MIAGSGRAEGGNDVVDAMTHERGDVHVTLDDQQTGQLAIGLPRLVQAIELLALVKHGRFRGVEIFRFAGPEDPAAETDDAAAAVADREHDAVAEAVVMATAVARDDQPCGEKMLPLLGGIREVAQQAIPSRWRVTDAEHLRGVAVETARAQILDSRRAVAQRFLEEVRRLCQHFIERRER